MCDKPKSSLSSGDKEENIIDNPKSWIAWKREAFRVKEAAQLRLHLTAFGVGIASFLVGWFSFYLLYLWQTNGGK